MLEHGNNKSLTYVDIKDMVQEDLLDAIANIKEDIEMFGPLTPRQIVKHEHTIQRLRRLYLSETININEQSDLVEKFCISRKIKPTSREYELIQREIIKSLASQEKARIELSKVHNQEPDFNVDDNSIKIDKSFTISEINKKFKTDYLEPFQNSNKD